MPRCLVVAEAVKGRANGAVGGLAKTTNTGIVHRLAYIAQQDEVAGPGTALGQAIDDLHLALRSDLAGVALAARLVGKEMPNALEHLPNLDRGVEHHDHTRPQSGINLGQGGKVEVDIQRRRTDEHTSSAAQKHATQLTAAGDPATVLLDECAQ